MLNISFRVLQVLYCLVTGGIAIICVALAISELRRWHHVASSQAVFLVSVAAFFGITAVSVARGWRAGAWLAGISGLLFLLYALSVFVLGWEDLGGARGVVPLALGFSFAGVLGLVVSFGISAGSSEAA